MHRSTAPVRSLWFRWILCSGAGVLVGIAVGVPLGAPAEALLGMALVLPAVGAAIGASLGTSQWLLLRRRARGAGAWIVATAAGVAVGLTGGTTLVEAVGLERGNPVDEQLALLVIGASVGFAVGTAQWLFLRRRGLGSSSWIAASTAGMAFGLVAGGVVAELLLGGIASAVGLGVVGLCTAVGSAATTGLAFARIAQTASPPGGA